MSAYLNNDDGNPEMQYDIGTVINLPTFKKVGLATRCLIVHSDVDTDIHLMPNQIYYIMPLCRCIETELHNYNPSAHTVTNRIEKKLNIWVKACNLREFRSLYGYIETDPNLLTNLSRDERKLVYYDSRESFTIKERAERTMIIKIYDSALLRCLMDD